MRDRKERWGFALIILAASLTLLPVSGAAARQGPVSLASISFIPGQLHRYVPQIKGWGLVRQNSPFAFSDALYSGDSAGAEFIGTEIINRFYAAPVVNKTVFRHYSRTTAGYNFVNEAPAVRPCAAVDKKIIDNNRAAGTAARKVTAPGVEHPPFERPVPPRSGMHPVTPPPGIHPPAVPPPLLKPPGHPPAVPPPFSKPPGPPPVVPPAFPKPPGHPPVVPPAPHQPQKGKHPGQSR